MLAVLQDHQLPRVGSDEDLAAQVGVLADHGVGQVVQQQELRVGAGERVLAAHEHETVWNKVVSVGLKEAHFRRGDVT